MIHKSKSKNKLLSTVVNNAPRRQPVRTSLLPQRIILTLTAEDLQLPLLHY
jgi:hypothetical protein